MISKSQRTLVLITLMTGTFMTAMTVTVTVTMLPAIMADYQIPTSTAQWLTSGATLVSGIMIPIAAFLMKQFHSKSYFIWAMVIFSFGALIGSIASNFPVLLIGRLIQAIGCGMLAPFAQIVLMTVYPREKHGSVMGIYALGSTVAAVVAPSLAGLVIDFLGWQYMFKLLFVIGIIIMLLGSCFMKNVTEVFRQNFPLLPIVLSSLGFSGLLIGLGNLSSHSLLSFQSGGALLIGLSSLGIFVYTQLKSNAPFLNLKIFRFSSFRTAVLMSITMYLICMGSGSLLPIFTQSVLGYSATTFALVNLPASIIMACISVFSGRIYDKTGPRVLIICGIVMLLLGSITGILFHKNTGLLHIGMVSCLLSAGTGFLNTPAITMALSNLEGKDRVDGSSILNTLRQISSSLATTFAILVYSLVSSYANQIPGVKAVYACYMALSILMFLIVLNILKKSKNLM